MSMRISEPFFTKMVSDARVEQLRGRKMIRRPRSTRSN
jgi:hypothetical protein